MKYNDENKCLLFALIDETLFIVITRHIKMPTGRGSASRTHAAA